jgi:hypothetical protein
MGKKKLKKTVKKIKKNPDIEHLETLLTYTLRAITSHGSTLDQFFENQANKIRAQIKEIEQKQ